jgi:hypothetical protein
MPTHLDVPAGFSVEGDAGDYILELQKTLYGLRQAGLNWFETLKQHLLSIGFKQSSIDQCCFIWDSLVLLCYVDDCLLFCSVITIKKPFLYVKMLLLMLVAVAAAAAVKTKNEVNPLPFSSFLQ